jgi:predicted HD superfamily hydrolase involved in NAD metabolism
MNITNIGEKIFNYLFENLNCKTFKHSYNVAILSEKLAFKHNVNTVEAITAGFLHDCAKNMTNSELIDSFKQNHEEFKCSKKLIKLAPHLLHSFAGAVIAKKKLKIEENSILNAIRYHTHGRRNMSALEKIIFVADFVSYDRKWKQITNLRKLAKKNLNKAFFKILTKKIEFIIKQDMFMSPQIINTWNWYVSHDKKNNYK